MPPERPRDPPARAGRAGRAGLAERGLALEAVRCGASAKRVTTGRIAMFCSLVQIGQFCSRRLWRQNDGIADSEHYMNAPGPRGGKNGGARTLWAPRRAREVGAQFPDRQGRVSPSQALFKHTCPEKVLFNPLQTVPR